MRCVAVLALACVIGCHAPAEKKRAPAAADGAAAQVADPVAKGEGRSLAVREIEHGRHRDARAPESALDVAEGTEASRDPQGEALAHEQRQYRRILIREIAWIDRAVASFERETAALPTGERADRLRDITVARRWLARLQGDLDAIGRGGTKWRALKVRIAHDLDDERPPSVPLSSEKSFGI